MRGDLWGGMSFCTRCGQQAAGAVQFCTRCGTLLKADDPAAPPPATPWQPAASWPPPAFPPTVPAPPVARRRSPRRPGGPGRWATAVIVVVVAARAGAAVAWQLTGQQTRVTPAESGSPAANATPATTAPATTAPASTTPATSTTSPGTSPPPSPGGVSVAIAPGAARQPGATQVAAFMAGYFNAINQRDYPGYLSKFDDQARPNYSRQKFLADFGTTTDSDPNLVALSPAAGGLLVTLTFVSHQSPAASATRTACTGWNLDLYLVSSGGTYLIGLLPPGSPQTSAAPC